MAQEKNNIQPIQQSNNALMWQIVSVIVVINLIFFLAVIMIRALTEIAESDASLFLVSTALFFTSLFFTVIIVLNTMRQWFATNYYVTDQSLIVQEYHRTKFNEQYYNLKKVEKITIDQTFSGKLFGYGTLKLALQKDQLEIPFVFKPEEVRKALKSRM